MPSIPVRALSDQTVEKRGVGQAKPKPCNACPWRVENQGKRHPGGWYTKANLRRLWARLRRGEQMTCHPTDPGNPVPEGHATVPEGATTVRCCGATILTQREFMRYQAIMRELPDGTPAREVMQEYRQRFGTRGLTLDGLVAVVERGLSFPPPFGSGPEARPDLNTEGIGHPDLVDWTPNETEVDEDQPAA